MSIVLLLRSLNIGGAQRQAANLARALHLNGENVTVVSFYDGGELQSDLQAAGVPVLAVGKRGRWDVVGFGWRLLRVLRRVRPHVIYAFLVEPSVTALLMKPLLGRPRVVWGVRASDMDLTQYGWFPRWMFRLSCWLARFADLVVVNSAAGVAYHAARGYPRDKMVLIPNGIDVDRFKPDPVARRRVRSEWRLPAGSRVVGIVGRLDPMKDHSTMLAALALLVPTRPDLFLVVVGDGPGKYRSNLTALAQRLGVDHRVIWAGSSHDMASVYNGFDICCLSSSFGEGFPNVLGEAMACEIPCVATDVGDATRILDGYGVIVPLGNPQELANGIARVFAEDDPERRRRGRAHVLREYNVAKMTAATVETLRTKVNGSP